MNTATLQKQVAEKVQLLYKISQDLETLFPGRHYTPDGHMIGSIGEALDWCRSKQPKFRRFPCPVSRNGCSS